MGNPFSSIRTNFEAMERFQKVLFGTYSQAKGIQKQIDIKQKISEN